MKKLEIEINPVVKSAILAIDNLSKQKVKEVKDHHICFGESYPVCGEDLNGRGLTNDADLISCPVCFQLMYVDEQLF